MKFERRADNDAERLSESGGEVHRIAAMLAGPPGQPRGAADAGPPGRREELPAVSVETVSAAIRARRLRAGFFDEQLFAEPAWDMLLHLFEAELAQRRVPVSSLCIAAGVPATTALRWVGALADKGLFIRRADRHDRRRMFVELAPRASLAMRRYFAKVARRGAS